MHYTSYGVYAPSLEGALLEIAALTLDIVGYYLTPVVVPVGSAENLSHTGKSGE